MKGRGRRSLCNISKTEFIMTFGTINVKLRPIKLAFLVEPTDKTALMEAIEINTFLWGGAFNPIIPIFKRIPKAWQDRPFRDLNSKKILSGYLDAYDPDYVVPIGKCPNSPLDVGNRQVISSAEILAGVEKDGTPKYGIGLFEVLRYFIDKELKFVRKEPLDVCLPNFGKRYGLFMASVFGSLPQNITQILDDNFVNILDAKKIPCSLSNYSEFLTSEKLFLRRISSLYIEPVRTRSWSRGACVFFLDATKLLDIIDYWNLRAVGWNVIPVPKQASQSERTRQLVLDFIEENYIPYRHNPEMFYNTTLLKSRSVTEDELKEFVKSLKIQSPENPVKSKIIQQSWYPRIWDDWAREKDDVECCDLEAGKIEYNLSDYQDMINFKTLDPDFMSRFGGHGEPRFVNEIDLRFFGDKELLAEVMPEGDENLARAIGNIGFREWRFSKKGMVYLSRHSDRSVHLSLPKAENVFSEWLKFKKWKVELSDKGHIAKQMLMQLGGTWGILTIANEGVIKLLEDMGEGKTMKKDAFWGEISKIANQMRFPEDPYKILQRLLDVQMFRLGIELQCPICKQHSWYSIKEADYEVQCPKCLERFPIPSHSPKEIEWSYRTFGPFSLPKRAYGAYTVLLTLRFFSQPTLKATTPIMSFSAERDAIKIEADLGLFYEETRFGKTKTELIFAECKTYNPFDKKDVNRMRFLGEQFPGAFLVFSTLNKSLTKNEKRLLTSVVNRGRRYWKAEHPFNPVLILTGTELFSDFGAPQCWKDADGKHAAFAQDYSVLTDLLQLCDVTQQLYLDMKPWHQWLRERWEKRIKKRVISSKRDVISKK